MDPRAVAVMKEIGIDISGQRSKGMDEYQGVLLDLAVTVCDKAKDACPLCGTALRPIPKVPSAKETIHKGFEDPAVAGDSKEEQPKKFRRVRDEIKEWIAQKFG